MNPKNLKAAFQMRSQMKEIQKKLKQTMVTESDKSEEITVTVDGTFKIKEIKLNISELDQTRIKKIENNLLATINKAIEKSQKNANSQLGSITNLLGM
ncbi:MAG: YbaB/EbfC family nucleoid-associated protein [Dehalococcoidia bacterium]|tara:strand:+ start:400 stop:693 length:294 start_codon:yes stop_codon:yes gene_type:complete